MTSHPHGGAATAPLEPAPQSNAPDAGGSDSPGLIPAWARASWLGQHILPKERAILAWLVRRCPVDLDPWDVLQETYAILAALPCVDHIASPLSYAFQVAHSLVLRHDRRAQIAPMTRYADPGELNLAADEPSPEQQVADRQELDFVAGLVAALPDRCREVFVLRRIQGVSQRVVAQQLGISEGTVEKHMTRALRQLAAAFSAAGAARQAGVAPARSADAGDRPGDFGRR